MCKLSLIFSCFLTDPSPTSVSPDSFVFYKPNTSPVSVSFSVDVTNVAVAQDGNAIAAVTSPGANFAVQVHLSDVNASSGTLGLQFSPTCAPNDLSQGLAAAMAETITINCNVDVVFDDTKCANIQYFCAQISAGMDAVFVDASMSNNIVCMDITSQKTCVPGRFNKTLEHDNTVGKLQQSNTIFYPFIFVFQIPQ